MLCACAACARQPGVTYTSASERFAPGESRFVVVFPALEKVRDEFLTLIVNANGMEGLLDIQKAVTGLDLADEELFDKAGLDPAFAPLAFERSGMVVVCLGLSDPERFVSFARTTVSATFPDLEETLTDGPTLYSTANGLAYAVEGNLAVIVKGPDRTARGVLAAVLNEKADGDKAADGAEGIRLTWKLGGGSGGGGGPEGDPETLKALAAMGPVSGVGHVVLDWLDRCGELSGTVTPGDRYLLDLKLAGCPFGTRGTAVLEPEGLLPEDTVLLLHWVPESGTLLSLLTRVQAALLELVWADAATGLPEAMADLTGLLGRFRAEVAVAFLGVDPEASVASFLTPADPLDPLLALHLAVLLPLAEGAEMPDLVPAGTEKEPFAGFEATAVADGPITGHEFCREKKEKRQCFSVLAAGRTLLFATGAGEGARLARVANGRSPTLAKALFNRQERGALTVTLKTRRLVKDMTALGFPPYFLQVLSSVLETRVAVDPSGSDTALKLEVVLR